MKDTCQQKKMFMRIQVDFFEETIHYPANRFIYLYGIRCTTIMIGRIFGLVIGLVLGELATLPSNLMFLWK